MSGGGQLLSPVGEPYLGAGAMRWPSAAAQRARPVLQPLLDWDGVLYGAMLLLLLFLNKLDTLGALGFMMVASVFLFRNRDAVRLVFHEQWFFLLFPLLTILSAFWSGIPADTLKHSLEFAFTAVAGLLLPAAKNQRSVIYGMFLAFALYAFFSVFSGNMVDVGTNGATALSGLADSKNEEASSAATGAMLALLWFFLGIQTRRYFQCVAALVAGLVELYATMLALSAGAIASLAVGVAAFIILAALSRAGRRLKVAVVGFGGVTALAIAMTFVLFTGQIVDLLSSAFGKDMTLTGRTYLWARARDLIVEHPWLGQGFNVFWQQGNLDAEGLWQYAHIRSRSGFNFHNTSYDILVALGWIGMALFALMLIVGIAKVAGAYVRRPSLLACFWLSMAAFMVVRMPVETMGTYEFSYATVLLFAVFGFGALSGRRQAWREAWHRASYETDFMPRGSYVRPSSMAGRSVKEGSSAHNMNPAG